LYNDILEITVLAGFEANAPIHRQIEEGMRQIRDIQSPIGELRRFPWHSVCGSIMAVSSMSP
jgi:hypothetical protein